MRLKTSPVVTISAVIWILAADAVVLGYLIWQVIRSVKAVLP